MARRKTPKPKREVTVLSRRLKELRDGLEMSQDELAEACGVDKTSVSHWELGISSPRPARMSAVAVALGVSVDELFDLYIEAKAS